MLMWLKVALRGRDERREHLSPLPFHTGGVKKGIGGQCPMLPLPLRRRDVAGIDDISCGVLNGP